MSAGDDYFFGSKQAYITPDKIRSRIFQGPFVQRTAAIMNDAFHTYYQAMKAAGRITDIGSPGSASYRILQDFQSKVWADIRAAAQKNSYSGLISSFDCSLRFCFDHLAQNKGTYTDEGWAPFKSFTSDVKMPTGVASFYEAIEERGTESVQNFHEWQKSRASLERVKVEKDWKTLGTKIEWTGKILDVAGPKLWALAKTPAELAERRNSLIVKCFDLAKDVHEYMESYNNITNTGTRDEAAIKLATELAALVLKKVPIFGDAYGDVVKGIPGLISWAQGVAQSHYGEYRR